MIAAAAAPQLQLACFVRICRYFNSVEYLWALLKSHFRKFMCVQKTHLTYEQFSGLVRKTFPLVTEEIAQNLFFANRKYLVE